VEACSQCVAVARPVLQDLRLGVEAQDECTVGLLVKQLGDVFVCNGLVAAEVSEHRSAGVHEDAKTDWEILMDFEGDNLPGPLSVVENAQIGEFEVVYWNAMEVGGVKGEANFVHGDVESVGIGRTR